MARTRKSKNAASGIDEEFYAKLAEETGGDILGKLESVPYFIDTGSLAVNYCLSGRFINGGIPGTKMSEVFGPSSSGKSLIAGNCLFGAQKLGGIASILDCENASDAEFIRSASHADTMHVLRFTPMTLERAFRKIHVVAPAVRKKYGDCPLLFVYDSISVSPCERELKENRLPEDYKASDWKRLVGRKEQPGERARVCGSELRKLQAVMGSLGITVLFINQIRSKVGVQFGSPETTGGGGMALPFYAGMRFRTSAQKKIKNKKLGSFAGLNFKVANKKNRMFRPFVETEGVKLYFDSGINPVSGLLSLLIQAERVQKQGKGYEVLPDYLPESREEYKFKASAVVNDVPVSLLLDCPAVIDAQSREEVEKYLAPFMVAIESSNSSDFEEKGVKVTADGELVETDEDDPYEAVEEGEEEAA